MQLLVNNVDNFFHFSLKLTRQIFLSPFNITCILPTGNNNVIVVVVVIIITIIIIIIIIIVVVVVVVVAAAVKNL